MDNTRDLRMASLYPAQCLGIDGERGRLGEGYKADIVHLDDDGQVANVWREGVSV